MSDDEMKIELTEQDPPQKPEAVEDSLLRSEDLTGATESADPGTSAVSFSDDSIGDVTASVSEIQEKNPSDSSTVDEASATQEEEVPVDIQKTGEKYIDHDTKEAWDKEDTAYEERRQRRAKQAAERKKKAQRKRIVTALIVLAIVCVAGLGITKGNVLSGSSSAGSSAGGQLESAVADSAEAVSSEAGSTENTVEETSPAVSEETTTVETSAEETTLEETTVEESTETAETVDASAVSADDPVSFFDGYYLDASDAPTITNTDVGSTYAVLVDLDDGSAIAQKEAETRISPASMTKILTVLVAAESMTQEDLDDTFTFTQDIMDYIYKNDCSTAGFELGETVTVRDLFYGTILPSGADAALGLAHYVAGTQPDFVDMMNDKLDELGLSDTAHFTNCIGLYDEDHYCTASDMAMILKAAVEDNWCRQVLSAHTYQTQATDVHPDGISLSNLFLRRIEDKDSHGNVLCAKTGFVNESGCCAASYMIGNDGKHYICVTGNTTSSWAAIMDHVRIYDEYVGN